MGRLSLICFALLALGTSAQRYSGQGSQKANDGGTGDGNDHVADYLLTYTFSGGAASGIADHTYYGGATHYVEAGGDGGTPANATQAQKLRSGIEKWCNNNGHSHSINSPGGFQNHGECVSHVPIGSCAAKATHSGQCDSYEPHNTRVGREDNEAAHTKFVETQGWKTMVDSSRCELSGADCVPKVACGGNATEALCNASGAPEQNCVWVARGYCIPLLLKETRFEDAATTLRDDCNAKVDEAACSITGNHGNPQFSYCIWVDQQASWGDKAFTAGGANKFPPSMTEARNDYAELPKVCRATNVANAAGCANFNTGGKALENKAACIADANCDWIGCGHNACAVNADGSVSVSCQATEVCDAKGVDAGASGAITNLTTYNDNRDDTQTPAQNTCVALTDQPGCEANKDCTWDKYGGTFGQCNAIECRGVSVGACHAAQPNAPSHCKVQRLNAHAPALNGRQGYDCSAHDVSPLDATTAQSVVDTAKGNCTGATFTIADPLYNATGGQGTPDSAKCEWITAGKCDDACKSGNDADGCADIGTCEWIYLAQNDGGGAECNPQTGSTAGTACNNQAHIGDASSSNVVGGNGPPASGTFRLQAYPAGELQVSLGDAASGLANWYTVCAESWGLDVQYASVADDTYNYWCQALGYPLGAHAGALQAPTAGNVAGADGNVVAAKGYAGTLAACSNTTGSLGATCTTDGNPIDWSGGASLAQNGNCTSALKLTCKGPRGGYRHNVIAGGRAAIARHCDFSPIQIAHARILQTAAGVVTTALRVATKTYCGTGNATCGVGGATAAGTGFANADKGSLQYATVAGKLKNAFQNQFQKGLTIWARDGNDYHADFAANTVSVSLSTIDGAKYFSIANVHSWPLIATSAAQWTALKKTFAHIDNTDTSKHCTVLNKLAVYTTACPRGTAGTKTWDAGEISGTYVPAAALDAYINGDRQYYPDKVCALVQGNTAVNGIADPSIGADTATCDAAFDCMRDKSGGSATSEEVERCSLAVLTDHYDTTLDAIMGALPATVGNIDVATKSGDLKTTTFDANVWSYQRSSGGTVNLLNASEYTGAIRDAWYDSFSEHNNWTTHNGKLCTATASGFRDLLTNTLSSSDPQGPFVAGFDQIYNGTGDGNPPATRSNRVGWENPRCGTPGDYYSYQRLGGTLFDAAGEDLASIAAGQQFQGAGNNPTTVSGLEGGQNWGAQYRGPSGICTGKSKTFTIDRAQGGCSGSPAAACSALSGADECSAAGCTYTAGPPATCEGTPIGCAAYTDKTKCSYANNGCTWTEKKSTLGTVSSLGQCKRLCRSNIDCQAVTVTNWAPPQSWSDALVAGLAGAVCGRKDDDDAANDDTCKGTKAGLLIGAIASKICVLCPHTPPAALATEPAEATWDSYKAGSTATHVRSGRGSNRDMAIYDITLYSGAAAAGNNVNLVKEAGGRQLRRSLQEAQPRVSIVADGGEVDEEQFREAMNDVMRANPHLRRFLSEEKVYPQRDEVIAKNPQATSTTANAATPTGPQTQNTSNTQSENVASASEEESMNSASRIITTSIISIMSLYALLQ